MKRILLAGATLTALGLPALSENFTTAAEVKPILGMQKDGWIAIREYDGRDLVYFTAVLAWRCGLDAIHYGLNGAPADTRLEMEVCHTDTGAPNALTGEGADSFIDQPLGSVERVSLRLTFDDGSEESGVYERESVLMP